MAKRNKIIYWIATVWLSLGMVSTGIAQLMKQPEGPGAVHSMARMGYPAYLGPMLGVLKILGAIVVLMPRLPQLKEWAYAGFFFIMAGAAYSHIAAGDPAVELFPCMLLLVLTIISWYFRPPGRKLISANQ